MSSAAAIVGAALGTVALAGGLTLALRTPLMAVLTELCVLQHRARFWQRACLLELVLGIALTSMIGIDVAAGGPLAMVITVVHWQMLSALASLMVIAAVVARESRRFDVNAVIATGAGSRTPEPTPTPQAAATATDRWGLWLTVAFGLGLGLSLLMLELVGLVLLPGVVPLLLVTARRRHQAAPTVIAFVGGFELPPLGLLLSSTSDAGVEPLYAAWVAVGVGVLGLGLWYAHGE